ncbi:2,3-diphosphoglycerate-dependent phosphoglycerate mutase [Enterococcus timonensis]|uniref:2,3-diphosphoglycerate-dependent phosphoglycerate mutase n=1 Tax=Enterococcus timonensis TaxID=1852364 RepID=UPI0008DB01B6|nr:2,3-diphosphoglycerate-dependent phosphoglycerate mutase [Enterococcus timonensis]
MELILLRHGESQANKDNIFTGWLDVPLTKKGIDEAKSVGKYFKKEKIEIDSVHTSILSRAILTTNIVLEESDQLFLPVGKSWRLNERHYGSLQGLNKEETALKYGNEQVKEWRRSFDKRPPTLHNALEDRRYKEIEKRSFIGGESLQDTLNRVIPYWQDFIVPDLLADKTVLVVAHGNSLRALVKYLEGISDEDIEQLNIPTGEPIIYKFDADLSIVSKEIVRKDF